MSHFCKRYVTFGGDELHENVGVDTYQGTFDTYSNAELHLKGRMAGFKGKQPWGQIFDTSTGRIIRLPEKE